MNQGKDNMTEAFARRRLQRLAVGALLAAGFSLPEICEVFGRSRSRPSIYRDAEFLATLRALRQDG